MLYQVSLSPVEKHIQICLGRLKEYPRIRSLTVDELKTVIQAVKAEQDPIKVVQILEAELSEKICRNSLH